MCTLNGMGRLTVTSSVITATQTTESSGLGGNAKHKLLAMRGCHYHYRWNEEYKATVLESRVNTTRLLADSIAASSHPPRAWVATSAEGNNNLIVMIINVTLH